MSEENAFDQYPHPGEFLLESIEELGISQEALAAHIGVKIQEIKEICEKHKPISARMALKLSKALGSPPRLWLEMQTNYDLINVAEIEYEHVEPISGGDWELDS